MPPKPPGMGGAPRKYCSTECRCRARDEKHSTAEKMRRWRERNPERALEINRRWQRANPEKIAAKVKAYRQTPAGRAMKRAAEARRRARKANAKVVESFNLAEVFERDGWRCGICGEPTNPEAKVPALDAPTLDHIVPLAMGGDHSLANAQCAHFSCNASKGARVA